MAKRTQQGPKSTVADELHRTNWSSPSSKGRALGCRVGEDQARSYVEGKGWNQYLPHGAPNSGPSAEVLDQATTFL